MYPVIFKESDNEFVILDAYYKGRWRVDADSLKQYFLYLIVKDADSENVLNSNLVQRLMRDFNYSKDEIAMIVREFEHTKMPSSCNFDPYNLWWNLNSFEDGIITPPTSIIEVTPYCNYRCPWCYIPPRSLSRQFFYSEEELMGHVVFPLIERYGALEWCLTGGEPTLFPEQTLSTAHLIKDQSLQVLGRPPKRMYMLTTGYDLADNIKRFKDAGINFYQVSLASPNEVHENLLRRSPRGIDSFRRALDGIDAIVDNGLTAEINMIIQPLGVNDADNLYDIPEMIELAAKHHVKMLRIIPAVPCGQAKQHNIWMTAQEYNKVAEMVMDGRKEYPEMIIDCPIDQRIEGDRSVFCRAGTLWLYIDFRGNIYPCNNLQDDSLKCWEASIKSENVDRIWRESKLLNYMRDYRRASINSTCSSCRLRSACAGECRAMTWARYRSLDLSTKPKNCFRDTLRQ